MSQCPKCAQPLESLDESGNAARCRGCDGLWVTGETLRKGIAIYLSNLGVEDQVIALHEMPAGNTGLACPECPGIRLTALKFRGVEVERCDRCGKIFLDDGDTDTISQRVLVSARKPEDSRKLSNNPKLESILANPGQFGSGGGY
jgi:Zn-finger nucleic acid-binding protein